MSEQEIIQERTMCSICSEQVFAAAGRAYCPHCNISFVHTRSRSELLSAFLLKYYMSKNSSFYHNSGCKYLRNVSPENLIETTEPHGKPCLCVR